MRRPPAYDAAIAGWFAPKVAAGPEDVPSRVLFGGRLKEVLRYGENPHQRAAFYVGGPTRPGVATATQLQGKSLSYNNLNDTDAAFEAVAEFDAPACVIVKHANPCGVAVAATPHEAWRLALRADPVSAFGGIVALNRPLDRGDRRRDRRHLHRGDRGPRRDRGRPARRSGKRKNLRLLVTGALPDPLAPGEVVRSVAGGFLVQGRDTGRLTAADLRVVTRRAPDAREIADLVFAFRVAKHVKSNAIVYARDGATIGIGAGQMRPARQRAHRGEQGSRRGARAAGAETLLAGSVAASDAFFPFADGLEEIVAAGAARG